MTRRTPGSTSSVTMPESNASVVIGEGDSVTAAGAISSLVGVVRTPASRKLPNSATMAPATTNLSAENIVNPLAGWRPFVVGMGAGGRTQGAATSAPLAGLRHAAMTLRARRRIASGPRPFLYHASRRDCICWSLIADLLRSVSGRRASISLQGGTHGLTAACKRE